jgi:hypothetical protein
MNRIGPDQTARRMTLQPRSKEEGMKRKQLLWKLLAVVAVVGLLFGSMAMADEETTISGTILDSDQGIVLATDEGATYMIEGANVADMVGKNVRVTGTLTEDETGKTISVTAIEEISNE